MKKNRRIPRKFCIGTVILAMILTGCAGRQIPSAEPESEGGKLNVVTTLFPYYDFTRQIAGDHIELTMVVPAGMDSHSFEPTPADMITIQNADVLICNGGAMEHWLERVLSAVESPHMVIMTGMDYVDTVQEEIVEGMEEETHDHDHGHGHGAEPGHEDMYSHDLADDNGHGEEIEYDEHIWTSPVNAMKLVKGIEETLSAADPGSRAEYEANAESYLLKLKQLDQEFRDVTAHEKRNMIIVGDKFPYRYLADEYGLRYRAAFSGCSTDTEPSARTIAYLIDKMKSEQIPVIYYPELTSHRVAEIIAEETGARPLLLHSCHNVTRREFDSGVTYLELMEQNVTNLKKGLE